MSMSHLSVVDLAQGVGGSYCTKLLADYGAEVVKIELPALDPVRGMGPFGGGVPHPERSGLFTFLNTNKRSLALDLERAEDRGILLGLLRRADILIEGFEPGRLASLGLDPVMLLDNNPGLVVTSITGFGQSGPYAGFRAPEIVLEAISGWMAGNGDPGCPPLKLPGNIQAQVYGGILGLIATLGAVRWRRHTGRGQHVDVSTMEAVLYTLPNITTVYQYSGDNWKRRATYPPDSPPSGIYQCSDGLIGCSAAYQSEWPGFCRLIERPDLVDDPRFTTRAERTTNAAELVRIISEWMARHPAEEVYHRGQGMKVPIARINSPRDLLASRQLGAREYWVSFEQPGLGPVTVPGAPFKLPASPYRLRRPAPRLGEHTREILADLDRGPAEATVSISPGERPESVTSATASDLPLAGVRVIDLCMAWAGPLSTRLLAGLGAEVIKIEGPQHMDRWRGGSIPSDKVESYPDRDPGSRPYNRYALANTQNLNKLDLALDLKHPRGKEIFKRLVSEADLVVENFSAGALERLELDYLVLREINPSVILVSLPSFGRTGPERDYVGHANFVEDTAGNSFLLGYPGGPPLHTGTAWGDPLAGVHAAAAALMAVLHRDTTGEGQHVDLAHVEAAVHFNVEAVLDFCLNGRIADRGGNDHPSSAPHGCYRARGDDAWIAIAVASDEEWRGLALAMGDPAWTREARFATESGRREHREDLDHLLQTWTAEIDHREAMLLLQSHGVAAGAVLNASDLCEDPQLAARDFLVKVVHPEAGTHRYPRQPWLSSAMQKQDHRPSPCFGQHNRYVLGSLLGMTDAEIDDLESHGVIAREPLPQYGV